MKKAACLVIGGIVLSSAHAAPSAWEKATLAAAAPYIDRANDEWTRAIVTGDADLMSAPYDNDGVFIRPDGSAIRGKAQVRDMYAKHPKDVTVLKASIRSDGRVAPDPTDVYEWGTAIISLKRGDTLQQRSGRYLTVWHLTGERWVITRNIAF